MTMDVDPRYRRLGVGRQLIRALESQARSAGCELITLHVFSGNAAAITFYEHNGFRRAHEALSYYGYRIDAWVYRKRLESASAGSAAGEAS